MFTAKRRPRPHAGIAILFVLATWMSPPIPAVAQSCDYSECVATASFSQHVTMLAINSLLGGVSAGVVRLAKGDPISNAFVDGFFRGAFGGGLTYAGKGVASRTFSGAGLLGRQIAALGVSTTANAADGIEFFDRVVFPLGPLPDDATLQDIYAARADAKARARAMGTSVAGATTAGGATFVSYLAPDERVLAHERVHTIQFDFLVGAVGDQIDTWAMERVPGVDRWLKINLVPALFGGINQVIFTQMNYNSLPWEREAALLSGYR